MTGYVLTVIAAGFFGAMMLGQFGSLFTKVTVFKNVEDQLPYYFVLNLHFQQRIASCRQHLADFPNVFTNVPLAHGDAIAMVLTDERLVD